MAAKENAEAMDEENSEEKKDAGSPRAEEERAQNGGLATDREEAPSAGGGGRDLTARSSHEHAQYENTAGSSSTAVKPPEEPPRRRFQIPRKSRETKALQLISSGSREFEEVMRILHSSYLDSISVANFTYTSARLVHNELLEKEFTEKRRELKFDGRLDKELAESYAFLLVDHAQVQIVCERGVLVGHSKITTLGNPMMGVYLSRYADLLQVNPLDPGTTGNVFIFKIIKGKMKSIYDHTGNSQLDPSSGNGALDPAPKHECHVFKNINVVTSLLSYRAFERAQYYFYEYGFDDIRKRPRHVCPYAIVSFKYKEEMTRSLSVTRSHSFNSERISDRASFTLWRGQLLSKGKLLCYASLRSAHGPFIPYKLPEKLDLEIFMHIDQIKKKIPSILFCKETHNKSREVVVGGMYSRLYEVVDKTRTGNNLQGLLQKLDKEKLALVKPLADKGFLFFFYPTQMTSSYGATCGKSRLLHALFLYQESREVREHPSNYSTTSTVMQDNHEMMPDNHEIMAELTTFLSSLHFALLKSQKDTSADFNVVVEKHVRIYLKRKANRSQKHKDFCLKTYDSRLDYKKSLYPAPKVKNHLDTALRNYVFGPEAYTLAVKRADELIKENQRFPHFSPVSDYEPVEDEEDVKTVNKNGPMHASFAEDVHEKVPDNADYDLDKLNGLINLIQSRKQNAFGKPETDDTSNGGFKRKLESGSENKRKHLKSEDNFHRDDGEEAVETSHSMSSFISALGGQDTDLRQESSESPVNDPSDCLKLLLETLADSGYLNSSLAQSLNEVLNLQNETTDKDLVQNREYDASAENMVTNSSAQDEQICYEDPQCPEQQESSETLITQPLNDDLQIKDEVATDHPVHIEEPHSGSVSPCPSTPTENVYHRRCSSNFESEMHWKLIPITGEEGRTPEDHVENLRDEKAQGLNLSEEQLVQRPPENAHPLDPRVLHRRRRISSGYSPHKEHRKERHRTFKYERDNRRDHIATKREHHLFETKHCENGVIENTVLEVYSIFSERLYEVLKQNDITFIGNATKPLLSSNERVARLSDWLYSQASDISVQQYIEALHEKLDSVVDSSLYSCEVDRTRNIVVGIKEPVESVLLVPKEEETTCVPFHTEMDTPEMQDQVHSSGLHHKDCEVQQSSKDDEYDIAEGDNKEASTMDNVSHELPPESPEKISNLTDINFSATHTALTDLINQMHPEVFNNLVKIFTHVNKNIVKFYIHAEEEENTCGEIKEYLTKLGNAECRPEQFLQSNAVSDKLLIIIQNEDIANCIHKIPALVTLKRLSCVSFAGVDSLDDLKNHTYNELFVSGGFVVSDETVLNPESVTVDALKKFLSFLEETDSPEGKWQWKIHCKFQKKLKELGRMNANALRMLTLLNTYQKKHLVEILSYHNCDSQTRQAPELDCLIKLQAQNIQQRHVIFLTEKSASLFPNYSDNGIVVTTMEDFTQNFTNLVGYHSSNTEENCLSQLAIQENQAGQSR
ncbi:protein TASOR isoform X3 [Ascaphus truei]|uniref:protein TASOR isoform X3 n=1 Tax=Ascaphus truei TaxID=8439 RepID=UPI003F59ABFE